MENSEVMILNIQVCQGGAGGGAVGGGAAHRLTHKIAEKCVTLKLHNSKSIHAVEVNLHTNKD